MEILHMAKLTPSQLAAKWQSKFANSTEAYKQGVNGVQQNPAQAAIAAKDRWIQALNDAAANGRFEAGLANVTLASWKQVTTDKGAANIAAGARNGAAKVQAHEQVFGPVRDSIVASLPPRGTLDQNIQRAIQMATQMAQTRNRKA